MKTALPKRACISCPSSDGLQAYKHEDKPTDGYCFSCHKYFRNIDHETLDVREYSFNDTNLLTKEEVLTYPIRGENDRQISEPVNSRYGVRVSKNTTSGEDDTVYYPYYIKNTLAGFKTRKLPKDFTTAVGSIKGVDLFGQNLCTSVLKKKLVITEGEEDALAITEAVWKHFNRQKFPDVVSLVNGSGIGDQFDKHMKFINQYSQVILCFDSDKPGRLAISEVASKVDPHNLFIMELSEKDASECLVSGKRDEIVEKFINPKPYKPNNVTSVKDLKDYLFEDEIDNSVRYPKDWFMMNKYTEGIRLGELDIFTGASSNGKTQILREIVFNLLNTTDSNIGCLFLEESTKNTLYGIGGLFINKRVTIPSVRKDLSADEKVRMWNELSKDNRIILRKNDWESMTENTIFNSILYMIRVEKCKYIVIDHLSILASESLGKNNIHEKVEGIVQKLKMIASTQFVWIGLAAHLRKGQAGKLAFEKGAIPTMEDLKSSSGAFQIPDGVFAVQRNRTHRDERMRNICRIHVLKNRLLAECGATDFLEYNTETGRMHAVPDPGLTIIEKEEREDSYKKPSFNKNSEDY